MKRRVSLVGFGRMGSRLVDACNNANLDVVAILDAAPTPWGLGQHPEMVDRVTSDAERFWTISSDVLVVATTAPTHGPLLLEGLKRGFRKFVIEKPFATGVDEARIALSEAERLGARVVVNHARRYCPNFAQLAKLNGSEALGKLRSIYTVLGGGSMGCLGVHFFDLFNWMYGAMPTKVAATTTEPTTTNVRGTQFDDPGGSVFLTYPCGGRAFLDIGDDIGVMGGTKLTFERGVVEVKNEFEPWSVKARRAEDREKPNAQYGLPLIDAQDLISWHDFSMMDRWTAMMRDAAGDGAVECDGNLGVQTLEIFSAARAAAADGTWVKLPTDPAISAKKFAIP